MILAHVAGVPVEELFLPLLFGAGALYTGIAGFIAHRRGSSEES